MKIFTYSCESRNFRLELNEKCLYIWEHIDDLMVTKAVVLSNEIDNWLFYDLNGRQDVVLSQVIRYCNNKILSNRIFY